MSDERCEMCDVRGGLCGEVRKGNGLTSDCYLSSANTMCEWAIWAAIRDKESGEVVAVTIVPVEYCPWCGARLDRLTA
nr:MAG TPA: YokU-like protein [Caudoviricetes sp.]